MNPNVDETVLRIVSEVLDKDGIGPQDDFFALGGTSLSAAVVTTKLEQALGMDISLRLLMEHSEIGAFSRALAGLGAAAQP